MAQKSLYIPVNPEKYLGDPKNIVCRSNWERQFCKWCDINSFVEGWGSETVAVPYRCGTDRRIHRYFVDFHVRFANGKEWLIEVKPKKELEPPKKRKNKTQRYRKEAMTFIKNRSKWTAAKIFAEQRGMEFHVFTEDSLKSLGLTLAYHK